MNKLTEIKEGVTIAKERGITTVPIKTSDLEYLLSLLEEKDKALAFYADEKNYAMKYNMFNKNVTSIQTSKINEDLGNIARKALNTSSNNEGETQS